MIMDKSNIAVDISKESNYSSVFQFDKQPPEFIELIEFYLYRVAISNDSPLSYKIDVSISDEQKDSLYSNLLSKIGISEADFLFSSFLRNIIKDIRAMKLSDTTLESDRIKGFFHQSNPGKGKPNQHKLDAMLKHIRNSFAHGRVGRIGEYIILEDKANELTARLIITIDALYKWKKEILSYLNRNLTKEDTR